MRIPLIAVVALLLAACSRDQLDSLISYLPDEHPDAQQAQDQQAPGQQQLPGQADAQQAAPTAAEGARALAQARMEARADRAPDSAARCKAVASQRASDGASMGYDDDAQKTIYDGTFNNCMAWDASHRWSAH